MDAVAFRAAVRLLQNLTQLDISYNLLTSQLDLSYNLLTSQLVLS